MFCWDWCQQPVPKDTKGISPASQPCSQAMPATGFAYATLLYGSGDRSLIFSSDSAGLIWYEKKLVKAWVHLICRLQCILYMKYLNTYIFCPCRIGLFLITFWRGITILLSSSLDMWWLRWPSWFIQPRLISLLNMIEIIPRVPKWSIMVNWFLVWTLTWAVCQDIFRFEDDCFLFQRGDSFQLSVPACYGPNNLQILVFWWSRLHP